MGIPPEANPFFASSIAATRNSSMGRIEPADAWCFKAGVHRGGKSCLGTSNSVLGTNPCFFRSSRKYPSNHFLNRHLLNINVAHWQFIEQRLANGNDPVALYLQLYAAGVFLHDLAVTVELLARTVRSTFAVNGYELEIREAIQHFAQSAIEENGSLIDNDDAFAEFLNVGHVMARQQDCGLVP